MMPLQIRVDVDADRDTSFLKSRTLTFSYRYIYKDGEISVFAPTTPHYPNQDMDNDDHKTTKKIVVGFPLNEATPTGIADDVEKIQFQDYGEITIPDELFWEITWLENTTPTGGGNIMIGGGITRGQKKEIYEYMNYILNLPYDFFDRKNMNNDDWKEGKNPYEHIIINLGKLNKYKLTNKSLKNINELIALFTNFQPDFINNSEFNSKNNSENEKKKIILIILKRKQQN